jgi:hypothetical protein
MKHTPEPWKCYHLVGSSDRVTEAHFVLSSKGRDMGTFAEQNANARLIAAAPELLEALRVIEEEADYASVRNEVFKGILRVARAAIAKATE